MTTTRGPDLRGDPDLHGHDVSQDVLTFEAALEVLQVRASVARADARRAYLQLLRQYKPELDPDGFKRLRAAWERVDAELDLRAALRLDDRRGVEADADASTQPGSEPGHGGAGGAGGDAPAVDDEAGERPAEPPLDRHTVPEWAREVAASFAAEHGGELDLSRLGAAFGASPQVGVVYAEELLGVRRYDLAAAVICRQLRMAEGSAEIDAPHPYRVVHLALRLTEHGAIAPAHRVVSALESYLSRTGGGARLSDELAGQWALTLELDRLDDEFPVAARAIIASAVRACDLPSAYGPLTEFTAREPAQAEAARACLRSSRHLRGVLSDALRPVYAARRGARGRRLERWGWFALMVACFAAVAFMVTDAEEAATERSLGRFQARQHTDDLVVVTHAVGSADQLQTLCLRRRIGCVAATRLARELDAGRCSDQALAALPDGRLGIEGQLAAALRARYGRVCK